jgi:hypothetical protein
MIGGYMIGPRRVRYNPDEEERFDECILEYYKVRTDHTYVSTDSYITGTLLELYEDQVPKVQIQNLKLWNRWPIWNSFRILSYWMLKNNIDPLFVTNKNTYFERLKSWILTLNKEQ